MSATATRPADQTARDALKARAAQERINRIAAAVKEINQLGLLDVGAGASHLVLADMGFSIRITPSTNTIRYRGVSASCTWSDGAGLISAWLSAADRTLRAFTASRETARPRHPEDGTPMGPQS